MVTKVLFLRTLGRVVFTFFGADFALPTLFGAGFAGPILFGAGSIEAHANKKTIKHTHKL